MRDALMPRCLYYDVIYVLRAKAARCRAQDDMMHAKDAHAMRCADARFSKELIFARAQQRCYAQIRKMPCARAVAVRLMRAFDAHGALMWLRA